jgi:general secretion pathway protein I
MNGPRRQRGFSLLEVLVAFAIMALSLGVLLRIFGGGGQLAGKADEHARAVVLARSLLDNVGVETPLQEGETSGEIDERYGWRLRVTPFNPEGDPLPDQYPYKPYWVELIVFWGEEDGMSEFSLGDLRFISQNLPGRPPGIGQGPRR